LAVRVGSNRPSAAVLNVVSDPIPSIRIDNRRVAARRGRGDREPAGLGTWEGIGQRKTPSLDEAPARQFNGPTCPPRGPPEHGL